MCNYQDGNKYKLAVTDASLLFIPILNNAHKDLKINLIDLSHGVSYDEISHDKKALKKWYAMKSDMHESLSELLENVDLKNRAKRPSSAVLLTELSL